ncbi:MAG: hypothetical protein R3A52_02930 [Polyangiales bacterium]
MFSPIGVGKTSEMLHAESLLRADGGPSLVVYDDPAEIPGVMADRGEAWLLRRSAVVLSTAARERGLLRSTRARQAAERLCLPPSTSPIPDEVEASDLLSIVLAELPGAGAVVLLDSLDREPVGDFEAKVLGGLRALRALNVGLVLTTPFAALYAPWRERLDGFVLHGLHPAPLDDAAELEWLRAVLDRRDPDGVITASARERLVCASGGIARHLIECARGAVTNAYQAGHASVDVTHVDAACEVFTDNHLLRGLTPDDRAVLEAVAAGARPSNANQRWIGLVASGCVLEHPSRPGRPRVHPLLAPFFVSRAA